MTKKKEENSKPQKSKESTKFDFFNEIKSTDDINKVTPYIIDRVKNIFTESKLDDKYNLIFLYDNERPIREYTADQIYKAIRGLSEKDNEKDLLLIISSPGGSIEPAYQISKLIKELSKKFIVVVPRRAKSAATLICLGADEIHMSTLSQLGPIDPQINGLPALGLGNAVEYLTNLTKKYPEASEMLARYLALKLDLQTLGYFERVSESAAQYAEKLLESKKLPKDMTVQKIAGSLVYLYKDHGFAIDKDEAKKFLGETIKVDTDECNLAEQIQSVLEEISLMAKIFKQKDLSIIGSIDGLFFFDSDNR
jgi:hypothetical protein